MSERERERVCVSQLHDVIFFHFSMNWPSLPLTVQKSLDPLLKTLIGTLPTMSSEKE